jgi:hypothetical protein
MDADYPAAHSMDTAWFAVDADGSVGRFQSGESGAVPVNAAEGNQVLVDVERQLGGVLPRCEAIFDLEGHRDVGQRSDGGWHWFNSGSAHGALLFLTSLEPVRKELGSGRAVPYVARSGNAVIFRQLAQSVARRLHEGGHCLGCFFFPSAHEPLGRAAALGLYCYSDPMGNWIAEPYGRKLLPSRPVHIDQLPPDLRDLLNRVRFPNLRFAETTHIQPCETQACRTWGPAYLTADGKRIREIVENPVDDGTGYEEFYREMTEQERDWLKEITIDPPRKR